MAKPFDARTAGAYPRVYRASGWYLISRVAGVVALAGLAAFIAVSGLGGGSFTSIGVIAAALLAWAAGLAFVVYSRRIELRADGIDVRDMSGEHSLSRAEIAGYRKHSTRYSSDAIMLESSQPGAEPVRVIDIGGRDQAYRDWFADLPDLDAQEIAEAKAIALADPALGSTPHERQARLTFWNRIAAGVSVITGALCLWVYFAPDPTEPAVIAACLLPLVGAALVLISKDRLTLFDGRKLARASVGMLLLGPALAFGLAVFTHMHVIDWRPALGVGAVAALLLGIAVIGAEPTARQEQKPQALFLWAALALAWGFGGAMALNQASDRDLGKVYPATVDNMRVSGGRYTSYELTLSPWGESHQQGLDGLGEAGESKLDVSSDLYDALEVGGRVCLHVFQGGLGWRWYRPEMCPAPDPRAAPPG